jgi:hypothetical protein
MTKINIFDGCSHTGKEIETWCNDSIRQVSSELLAPYTREGYSKQVEKIKLVMAIQEKYFSGAQHPLRSSLHYNCRMKHGGVFIYRDTNKSPRKEQLSPASTTAGIQIDKKDAPKCEGCHQSLRTSNELSRGLCDECMWDIKRMQEGQHHDDGKSIHVSTTTGKK